MKKTLVIILFSICIISAQGQDDNRADFKESSLNSGYADKTDILGEVTGYDFST